MPVISSGAFSVKNLTINNAAATLEITGGSLNVVTSQTLTAGAITLSNAAALTFATALTIPSGFTLTANNSSTVLGSGANTINANGVLTLNNSAAFTSTGAFSNAGNLNLNGTSNLTITGSAFTNSGTFTPASGSTVTLNNGTGYTMPAVNFGNLTISGTGSYILGASTTIAGNFTQSSGTFTVTSGASAYTMTIGGNFNQSAGTFNVTGAAAVTGATVTVTGSTSIFSMFMEPNSSNTTSTVLFQANGDATFTGTSSTSAFNWMQGGSSGVIYDITFGIKGYFNWSGTGKPWVSGSGTPKGFVFNGSGTIVSPQTLTYNGASASYGNNYVVNAGTVVKLLTTVAIGTNTNPYDLFTVNGTLDAQGYVISGGSGTANAINTGFSLAADATLMTKSATGVNGNITTALKNFSSTANYVFNGTTDQVTGALLTAAKNIDLTNNTGKVALSSNVAVSGTLTIPTGNKLDAASYVVSGGGNINLQSGGTLISAIATGLDGNITTSGGSSIFSTGANYTFNGTSAQVTGTYLPTTINNLTIDNTAGVKLSNTALTVNGTLLVNSGKLFTIENGKQVTVSGTLTNTTAANLVINSGGSLIQSSGSVAATVERNIPAWVDAAHGWHFLSSPVTTQAIATAFTTTPDTDYDFYAWWEPTNEWVNYKNTTTAPVWNTANTLYVNGSTVNGAGAFIPGKGYLVSYAAVSTKQFTGSGTGALNKDNVGISNLAISAGTNNGWHLLGNPFTSAITWGTGWSLTHINATAKIWNESSASYTDISTGGKIPALNGFMVQVEATFGGNNSLTIPTSARTHDATAWYKSTDYPHIVLVANDPAGQTAQENVIRFDEGATTGFDAAFDSHFLPGYAPSFYSVAGTEHLSTNSLPEVGGTVQIPVSFVKNDGSNFTIKAKTISGLFGPVILNDLKTNTSQDLTLNPEYSFTSAAGDDPNRFLVTFHSVGINETPAGKAFTIYTSGNNLYVTDITGKNQGVVYVYNLMGQLLSQQNIGGNVTKININAPTGYYLVKVVTSEQAYTTKVFISN